MSIFVREDYDTVSKDNYRKSGHPLFYKLLDEMGYIHSIKNQDYGDGNPLGNFMESEGLGVSAFQGVLVRMSDKWSRIKSLVKQANMVGKVKDESIEDTLIDLANYAILAIIIRRETQSKDSAVVRGNSIDLGEAV